MADTLKLKNFEFGNATDTGRVREKNEDYLGYFETVNGHVFVVCDGMGGHVGGATASRLSVEAVRELLESKYFDIPADALREAIDSANEAVYRKAAENPALSGMGTTIVLMIVRDNKAYYAHVGDSRIYIHSGNKLYRLTSDHSYVQSLVDQGLLAEEEMESHPRRNEILRALGIRGDVEVTIGSSPVKPANTDTLLLCTDGLNSMISDAMIEGVLNENISVQHKALKLVQLANEAGGYDNTTIQLISFYNVSNKKSEFIPASAGKKGTEEDPQTQKKAKMKKFIIYGVIGLCILAILYFVWDMFIRSSAPVPLLPEKTVDTLKQNHEDTVRQPPVAEDKVKPAGKDTFWITYTVQKGDVLGRIGTKFNVPLTVIKKKNKLSGDNISLGSNLYIPVKAAYVVKEGENLDAIANKFSADKNKIKSANGFKNDADMKAGKGIYIPF